MTNSELKLGVLTQRQRQVLELSKTYNLLTIAIKLGIAYETVKRHLAGARARLRNKRIVQSIVQKVNHRHD